MTRNSYLKLEIRTRMERTGESYSAAARAVAKGEDLSRSVTKDEDFEFPQLPFSPPTREPQSPALDEVDHEEDSSIAIFRKRRAKENRLKALIIFSEQAAALMEAGLPLSQVFEILAQHTEDPVLRDGLHSVLEEARQGIPMEKTLGMHPEVFPGIFSSVIASSTSIYSGLKAMADVYRTELELL